MSKIPPYLHRRLTAHKVNLGDNTLQPQCMELQINYWAYFDGPQYYIRANEKFS